MREKGFSKVQAGAAMVCVSQVAMVTGENEGG